MYIVDSSVWVSLFLQNDSMHEIAIEVFGSINEKIIIPYCVINEVCTVLTYKHSKDLSNNFLDFVVNNDSIFIIDNDYKSEILFFKKVSSGVSFTDLSVIKLAMDYGCKLITFDEQMKKLYIKLK